MFFVIEKQQNKNDNKLCENLILINYQIWLSMERIQQ